MQHSGDHTEPACLSSQTLGTLTLRCQIKPKIRSKLARGFDWRQVGVLRQKPNIFPPGKRKFRMRLARTVSVSTLVKIQRVNPCLMWGTSRATAHFCYYILRPPPMLLPPHHRSRIATRHLKNLIYNRCCPQNCASICTFLA